jgi:tripartite-type tricarboxylate transporter receptor subunit TctC
MHSDRRVFLRAFAGTAGILPLASKIVWASDYPARPVRIVVGFAAGGATDVIARLIGDELSKRFGQAFIVENKPGAGSNIAVEAALAAPADGYTLLFVGPSNAINATLYDKLDFDFMHDIAPVAALARVPFVVVVGTSFPAKTVAEFVDYAKANPGKLSIGTPGKGSGPHMAAELFAAMAGVELTTVQYRGDAPALTDLMGGQIQACFNSLPAAMEFIKSDKVHALATTAANRSNSLPDIPTIAEFVSGYEASAFYGIGTRRGAPTTVIDELSMAIQTILSDQQVQARLVGLGATVLALSAPDFGKLIAEETDKWAKVIRSAGIKSD